MAQAHHLFHMHRLSKRRQRQALDRTVLVASFIQPMSGVPQAVAVWSGSGDISVATWLLLTAFGLLFLVYGIVHRIWPLIIVNIIWTVIDAIILVGALK